MDSSFDPEVDVVAPRKGFRKLYLAAFAAWMGSVSMGAVLGYSSPALHSMEKPHSHFKHLTEDEQSWVGSIMAIGALVGGIVAGPLIDSFGRRTIFVFVSLPFVASWLLIAFCNGSLMLLLIGRIITGFCAGMVSLMVPIYVAETAMSDVRGILGSCCQLSIVSGVLFIYLLGEVLEWVNLALVCAFFPLLTAFLMLFMTETPCWLIRQGRRDEALESIEFLNGDTVIPEEIYFEIERCISQQPTGRVSWVELKKPALYKPFCISVGLMLIQQWCGVNGIMFYAATIFKQSKYDSISPTISGIILAANLVLATIVSSAIMDKAGRKTFLYISSVGMAIGLISMGVLLLLGDKYGDAFEMKYGWANIVSLSFYLSAFSLGYGPIPWLMMGEINNSRVRGLASSFTTMFNWINVFLVTKEFMDMLKAMNGYGTYFFFAGVCVLSLFFTYYFVPETKGRSLEEIEVWFSTSEAVAPLETLAGPRLPLESEEQRRLINEDSTEVTRYTIN